MSEKRKKYLVSVITSTVASVLLVAFCFIAIAGNIMKERAEEKGSDEPEFRTAVIYSSKDDRDFFYQNDEVIHMSVEIPAVRMKSDSALEFTVSIGNSTDLEFLPDSVDLTVESSYQIYPGKPFEIQRGNKEFNGRNTYYAFDTSIYECTECYCDDERCNKFDCDFKFSEKYFARYTDDSNSVREGVIVFRVSGEGRQRNMPSGEDNGQHEKTKWFGRVVVYFTAGYGRIAFGSTSYGASRLFYGGKLPGEMDCRG